MSDALLLAGLVREVALNGGSVAAGWHNGVDLGLSVCEPWLGVKIKRQSDSHVGLAVGELLRYDRQLRKWLGQAGTWRLLRVPFLSCQSVLSFTL